MTDPRSFVHRLWHRAHRIDSWMLFGFIVAIVVLTGLGKLASEILEGDSFAFDRALVTGLRTATDPAQAIAPGWVTSAMIDITAMGGGTVLTLVTLFAVGYLAALGRYRIAMLVAAVIVSGAIATDLLKMFFDRARPDLVPHMVEVSSRSFPSGHSMNSALVYLTLAALVARTRTDTGVRIYLMGVALLLTFFVGVSRVYLGVHWPTDVLAGWGVGALWAALASLVAKRLQERHEIEPASAGEEID
ncbi:phosphatase PAP2 family protein [Sphingomicrobium sp. XHP0239]|uniref:phosphatase PAP2 family protein n=1 Tax=Sphingomicrobium maritimum TaxID=3133972 RepID=UPI0031CC4E67